MIALEIITYFATYCNSFSILVYIELNIYFNDSKSFYFWLFLTICKFPPLMPKGATCQNLTFSMIATLVCHISFIQSLFLMKIIGLDSNSNLVFVVKISAQSKML